ncbi:hypothetical protein SISSUDRAFT_1051784 [Sistotremastrum suecicum HHB10207 ss-3]|uniref:Uncharacterized protein n=1 Tax=Sistotremastrum suecicum HHB10207 ss-3 TaxID=1314776 RepID=A0A166AAV2_9AGAM|nr:hypothetical protein SISSUDRAFT_1051784 [Sistotremastrum suecicum HHB10207 ss-3]
MYLIKFYTIDGIVLQPEIVYDGTIQAIEWVSTDNGGRTTLAMVVEAATSKQHILVYDLIYTITDCNTEKLDVKKLAEVDLPSSFGQCYALTLRAPYLVLLGEIGIAILDWVTGRRSQCFLDGGDELQRNLALQRADIHPSRPELILQFSTFLAGIWIETLTIDDLVLPRSTNGDTWNHYIHSANESFTRFSECRIAKVSPISSLVNDTSGTFDMVFSMTRRSDEGPSFCTISLSLADSSLSLKHHGCSSLNHDIASYKTSRGDKALVFRNDYAFFHRVDYYPAKGEYHDHDDLRFIFPPYEVVENIGSRMRDVRLGLPDWCWKCKRRAIVGVDNIYGFALLWTDSGLWVVKY